MRASRSGRLFYFLTVVFVMSAVVVPEAMAQWTFRVAPSPIIRNVTLYSNTPTTGTNTLFVSTLTDGMYKATEIVSTQTVTWQKINNGLPIVQVRTHTSIDSITMYALTDGAGLFKTIDGGTTWSALNGSGSTALGCLNTRSFNFDSTTPRTLIVGTACRNNSGFYKSTDDGATWARLGNANLPDDVFVSALTRDTTSGTYYVATSNYGIYKSTNSGTTWAPANTGIAVPPGSFNVFNIQFNGTAPNNLLAYVHGSGIYRSTDGGANWAASSAGLPSGFAALAGISKESNTVLYIGLDKQGLYKTTDSGLNWTPWGNTAANGAARFARNIFTTGIASTYYIGTLDGLTKTVDNAATINDMNSPSGGRINAITHDSVTPAKAYVTGPTVFRLNNIYGDCNVAGVCGPMDTGVTGNTIEGVAYQDLTSPAILYVTTSNRGIFKSSDGGTSFSAINNGLPSMIGQASRLAIDPNNSLILYLGLRDGAGVFKSTDGGANWTAANNGLTSAAMKSIGFLGADQNNSSILYAATDAGLYKSIDSAASWVLKYSATDSAGSLLPTGSVRVRTGNSLEVYIANYHVNAGGSIRSTSGVLKSTDGGTSWTNILPNLLASQVRVLVNGEIFAGISNTSGNPAVYRSTNGGTSFAPYSGGLNGSDIRTFGVAANGSAVLSLSLENGFYTHNAAQPSSVVPILFFLMD